MRRLSATAPLLVITLLAMGGLASATLAQDASSTTADSPVVGAWLLMVADDPATPPQEMVFHADGTYIQYDGTGGVGIGTWEPTGASSGMVTIVQYGLDDTGAVGHSTVRATFEVAPDGQSLSADYTLEYFGSDGSDTGQMGPGTVTGTRIVGEPMGTPVMPLQGPVASPTP